MIRNYYTLLKVVEEFQVLKGATLSDCFSQEKNSLVLELFGDEEFYVQYYGKPQIASMFLRDDFAKARKNVVDLFAPIVGETVESVEISSDDRIIKLYFGEYNLYFFVFGGPKSNVFLTDSKDTVTDAFKSSDKYVGSKLSAPKGSLKSIDDFKPETTIYKVLSKSNYKLGKRYAAEILSRAGIDKNAKLGEFSLERLKSEAEKFIAELKSSEKFYLYGGRSSVLSLTPLSEREEPEKIFDSISAAIRERVVGYLKNEKFDSISGSLEKRLIRRKDKLAKTLTELQNETKAESRAAKYQKYAEVLMAQPNPKIKAGDSINLEDFSGETIEIPLEKERSLLENAQKYFDKARSTREELKIRKKRIPKTKDELSAVQKILNQLEKARTVKEIEKIQKEANKILGSGMKEDSADAKFRTFDLGEGFVLYVGKNAAENDELTMKFAKPNDLWFHARGAGGSHAVLRLGKKQKPSKHIIQKAASIALYYSKARNAKYAPVAYTYKKYVRKPKGANPGSVVIAREQVIMAEPNLP